MKPLKSKSMESLNIVIYAQSGILAGDLAALLSGHHTVDRQTSLPGVLKSLNFKTDVLLLVSGETVERLPDPTPVLAAAIEACCRVIMLGSWPGLWREFVSKNKSGFIVNLTEIPSPAVLFRLIGGPGQASG